MKKFALGLGILMIVISMTFISCKKGGAAPSLTTGTSVAVEIFDRGTDGGRSLAYDNAWTNWIKEKVSVPRLFPGGIL